MDPVKYSKGRGNWGKPTGRHYARLGVFTGEGASKAEAKAALLDKIAAWKPKSRHLFCVTGEVLAVRDQPDGGGYYDILHATREGAMPGWCGGVGAGDTFDEALECAKRHAESSYGGVVKEAWA